jgi:hypothetical protein
VCCYNRCRSKVIICCQGNLGFINIAVVMLLRDVHCVEHFWAYTMQYSYYNVNVRLYLRFDYVKSCYILFTQRQVVNLFISLLCIITEF